MTIIRMVAVLGAMLSGVLNSPAAEEVRLTYEQRLMGTRFRVVVFASSAAAAERAADVAFAEADRIEQLASDYRPDSELSKLSNHQVHQPVELSPTLFDLLEMGRGIAEEADGAFDPTLGPLSKLWRQARRQRRLPGEDRLERARESIGWRHFALDAGERSIVLGKEGMAFDLGGLAKGYAADRMLDILERAGFPRALVSAGGDVRVGDPPPGRQGWRVAVRTFDLVEMHEVLELANAAVSTSGDLHQSLVIEGQRFSHIIDPATGLGLRRRIAARVIADRAAISDPLATAACVLGPNGGERLRKIPGVREVRIVMP